MSSLNVLKRMQNPGTFNHPPPVPLILAGWVFSNDHEKKRRWDQTIEWAIANDCEDLITVDDDEYYVTDELSY